MIELEIQDHQLGDVIVNIATEEEEQTDTSEIDARIDTHQKTFKGEAIDTLVKTV